MRLFCWLKYYSYRNSRVIRKIMVPVKTRCFRVDGLIALVPAEDQETGSQQCDHVT